MMNEPLLPEIGGPCPPGTPDAGIIHVVNYDQSPLLPQSEGEPERMSVVGELVEVDGKKMIRFTL